MNVDWINVAQDKAQWWDMWTRQWTYGFHKGGRFVDQDSSY